MPARTAGSSSCSRSCSPAALLPAGAAVEVEQRCFADARGDVVDVFDVPVDAPHGDIVEHCAAHGPTTVTFTVETASGYTLGPPVPASGIRRCSARSPR